MPLYIRRLIESIHPSGFLLTAQILFLVLYAAFAGSHSERSLISAFGIIVLVLRVWIVNRSPAFSWIAWVLALPTLILALLSVFFTNPQLLIWTSLLEAALYFYAAASLIAYMMEDYVVTTDELFAAGATFTLLAWGFAYLYLICQTIAPGSFASSVIPSPSLTFIELLFLSFTNLSSAGLSDIVPVTTTARVLLMIEQLVGVGYVAVVISRLVGLTVLRQGARNR